jgi:hypothetical protein
MSQYCRVTRDGIAHLFLGLDFGSVCVCGRKMYSFALDTEDPTLLDVPQQPAPPWRKADVSERVGNARFLL